MKTPFLALFVLLASVSPTTVVALEVITELVLPAVTSSDEESEKLSETGKEQTSETDEKSASKSAEKSDVKSKSKADEPEELSLRKLFPKEYKRSSRISGMAFSHDSQLGAYLYQPVREARHGTDLWIYNTKTGESTRVTMASVMAKYQKQTRDVTKDRIKKAKKTLKKKKKKEDSGKAKDETDKEESVGEKETEDENNEEADNKDNEEKDANEKDKKQDDDANEDGVEDKDNNEKNTKAKLTDTKKEEVIAAKKRGDWVSKKDIDDKKAPRYGGVSSFRWSPVSNELLFSSAGDLYRLVLSEDNTTPTITRLTRTSARESSARYLPDGTGFTYSTSSLLYKVKFDSSLIEQLTPKLPSGEQIRRHSLSPDGKRLAVITWKETTKGESHEVEITQFTSRFAKAKKINRSTSESKSSVHEINYYLYDLTDLFNEENELHKVHTFQDNSALDSYNTPTWAMDSSKIAFATYDEATTTMRIHEAKYPTDAEVQLALDEEASIKAAIKLTKEEQKKKDKKNADKTEEDKAEELKEKRNKQLKPKARVVYQFMHNGGPNTTRMLKTFYMPDNRRIIFNCEISGYRQLHVLDPTDEFLEPLTRGRYEIYPIRMTKDHQTIYATATKGDPSRRSILKIDVESGTVTDLQKTPGYYSSVAVSDDGNHVLGIYSTFGKLRDLVHIDVQSDEPMKVLTESNPADADKFKKAIPERFTYTNRHGNTIHGQLFKPDDWSKDDKRPLLVYVYGGPLGTRHSVTDGSYAGNSYHFAWYMAKKHGYVTCTIDPRGVSGYGAVFEKANYQRVGKPQVEDLTDGVKHLIANYGIDGQRVGIYGWSFGGFQTQMCLYTRPDVFQVGIAGAGPTEWENYNLGYTTATIGKSRTGKTDLKKYSLLPLAKGLQGKLLLVHGMVDSNVLYQDTVNVYRELLKQGKEVNVELFLDPTGNHGLGGDIKNYAKYHKYEDFFLRYLGAVEQTTNEPEPEPEDKTEKTNEKAAGESKSESQTESESESTTQAD